MVAVLVWLLIFLIIAGVIYYVLTLLPLPDPFKRIVMVVFMLIICLVAIFKLLPLLGIAAP